MALRGVYNYTGFLDDPVQLLNHNTIICYQRTTLITGLQSFNLINLGPYRALLSLTGPYLALICLTEPYWALLGLTGPYLAFFSPFLHLH